MTDKPALEPTRPRVFLVAAAFSAAVWLGVLVLLVVTLASCAAAPAAGLEPVTFVEPIEAPPPRVHVQTPSPTPVPSPAAPASVVLQEGQDAQHEARRYAAWSESKPANIDRLSVLTAAVSRATAVMEQHRQPNRQYRVDDVCAASRAVDALRHFLANKDD